MQSNLRKLLLRVMLVSLGAAAVIGALAMLAFDHGIVWRVVGTTVATAVAAGLMMSMSMLADRERCHTAGVVGMGAVVAEFLVCLVLVWGSDHLSWRYEERCIVTMLWIAGTALPGMFFLRLAASPATRLAGHVGAGAYAATFLVGAGASWLTSGWSDYEDHWATAMILANFGTLGALALIGAGRSDRRYWRYAGVGASFIGAVVAIVATWFDLEGGGGTFAVIASVAVFVPVAIVLLLVPVKPGQAWLVRATIVAAAVTAIFTDLAIVFDDVNAIEDLTARVAGAAGILAACGALALGVLARLNRKLGHTPVLSEIRQLTLVCPGCESKQTLPVGDASCGRCGLIIHTRIEEPRCPRCDYLLYMLTSANCPECGTPVRHRPLPAAA
jgi:hypothetical protein